ncbi:hypothetical protein PM027_22010 [[Clostridium] symbiosum]|uniref:hypothetical protein n=1 Tax=Clostridium symbiosum TaxID=1512 RepID=UPI00189B5C90|nr:hypothetical protein [[Clostridium] symbiosum]MDB2020709.1 hypothetical protein [[Clostridium] symbiosum]
MKCKYCGDDMFLDDKYFYIGRGGVQVVEKYWVCDCGASAYQKLVSGKTEYLEFCPSEDNV